MLRIVMAAVDGFLLMMPSTISRKYYDINTDRGAASFLPNCGGKEAGPR
jgi:hypothetical protein